MIITREFLNSGIREGMVLCYEQCRILGIEYPPSNRWKEHIIGKELADEKASKFLSLKEKTTLNPKLLKAERKKTSEHSSNPYIPHCQPVYNADKTKVIITEEWLRSGLISGIAIKNSQAKLLGINQKKKGWFIGLIGAEIPVDIAEKYIALKYEVRKIKVKKRKRKENTQMFIKQYLNAAENTERKTVEGKISRIRYLSQVYDKQKIITYIRKMPYKDFLKTPYWKAIADFQKYESNYCCIICGSKNILNVHHTTYKNHGDEAIHLEDLITVCRDCHKAIHGID